MGEGRALQTSNCFSIDKKNVNKVSLSLDSFFFFSFAGWVDLGRLNCVLFFFHGFSSFCWFKDRGNAAAVTETGSVWQL